MKIFVTAILAWMALPISTHVKQSELDSARSYYKELYDAGGLDNFADEYACFHDDPSSKNFFIIAKSDAMRDFLKSTPAWRKFTAKHRADLERGFLLRVAYAKGLANGMEYLDPDATPGTFVEDFDLPAQGGSKALPARLTLQISWQTLRYRVAITKRPGLIAMAEDTGRCEAIPGQVRQHGHE